MPDFLSNLVRHVSSGSSVDGEARHQIAAGKWQIEDAPSAPDEVLAWDLGSGETAVLADGLANPGWTAILDDGAARRCARTFAVPLKGTLGVVLLAKRRGLVTSAEGVLRSVRQQGFRLEDRLVSAALRELDETWD